jgi:hypothetical protein
MRPFYAILFVSLTAPLHAFPGEHIATIEDPEGPVLFGSHQFAAAAAGLGNSIIVSATPSLALLPGEVYLFSETGQPLREIPDPNPHAAGQSIFGYAVAGDAGTQTILIGAPGIGLGSPVGPTYLFDGTTGEEIFALLPTHRSFGSAVAFFGNGNILVGAPGQNRAYAFDQAGNSLFTLAPQSDLIEGFGQSLAGTGNTIVVGAGGAAFLFDESGELQHTLTTSRPSTAESFGRSVAAISRGIIVGAPSSADPDESAVFVFDELSGNILLTIDNPNPASGVAFGDTVAAHGQNIAVSAPGFGEDYIYVFDSITGSPLLAGVDICGSSCTFAATDTSVLVGQPSLVLSAKQTLDVFEGIGQYVCDMNGDGACTIADLDELTSSAEIDQWLTTAGLLNIGTPYRRGDVDLDGDIDSDDYTAWKAVFGSTISPAADANGNGVVDAADYTVWRDNLSPGYRLARRSATPEPDTSTLALIGAACLLIFIRSQRKSL